MVAVRSPDPHVIPEVLLRFRSLVDGGQATPPEFGAHRDGWGIVGLIHDRLQYLGRRPTDAAIDPIYVEAASRTVSVDPNSWVVAHVRLGTRNARKVANTHPFLREGWAFAHNGGIQGLGPPAALAPEGETDSERFFLQVLSRIQGGRPALDSLTDATEEIVRSHSFSSLKAMLTDGRSLIAQRKVGPGRTDCETRECALNYYSLGMGQWRGAEVVASEAAFLPGLRDWRELQDGETVKLG